MASSKVGLGDAQDEFPALLWVPFLIWGKSLKSLWDFEESLCALSAQIPQIQEVSGFPHILLSLVCKMMKKCSILAYSCNEEYNDSEEPISCDGVLLLPLLLSSLGWTSHPWKDVKVQLTHKCTLLLRRFFNDAKFVVFELQVGQLSWRKSEAPELRFQAVGKSGFTYPLCYQLCSQQQHSALSLHRHWWQCTELIYPENLQK